jgi:hypothetical protein
MFIALFREAPPPPLFPILTQIKLTTSSQPISLRTTLILCSYLRLGLPSIFLRIRFGVYKSLSQSQRYFLQRPVNSSLVGTNFSVSTLLSNTLSLCSSLNMTHYVLVPPKTNSTSVFHVLYRSTECVQCHNLCNILWHVNFHNEELLALLPNIS